MIKKEDSQLTYENEPRKNKQVTIILPPDLYDKFLDTVVKKRLMPNDVFKQLVSDYVKNNGYQYKNNKEINLKGFIL